jgi:UPF0755 protein
MKKPLLPLPTKTLLLHSLAIGLLLLLIIPLAYNFIPIGKGNPTFYLSQSSHHALLKTMQGHGYRVSPLDRLLLAPLKALPVGWYHIEDIPLKRSTLFSHLRGAKTTTIRVKVYAGENAHEMTKRLANDLDLNQTKLLQLYQQYSQYTEGDILANFYRVSTKANEEGIIKALYALSNQELNDFKAQHCNEEVNELEFKILLTIASIIQKETNDPKEMPLVSSVIANRLAKGMKLQMDATLNYAKHSHKIITPERIRSDESYYNTYKHKGIPPTPLCAVTLDALTSALYPKETNYLYFMLNKEGGHNFSATYEEHKRHIHSFRQESKSIINTTPKEEDSNSSS